MVELVSGGRLRFYALKGSEEKDKSVIVVIGTLNVFYFLVYALLDPGSNLSLATPLVSSKFDMLPEILHKPFLVNTPIGNIIRA